MEANPENALLAALDLQTRLNNDQRRVRVHAAEPGEAPPALGRRRSDSEPFGPAPGHERGHAHAHRHWRANNDAVPGWASNWDKNGRPARAYCDKEPLDAAVPSAPEVRIERALSLPADLDSLYARSQRRRRESAQLCGKLHLAVRQWASLQADRRTVTMPRSSAAQDCEPA
jgi:hypothetical protein